LPKLSVCIPVYNGADTIEKTIDSVLTQSYSDFECVVVDNCSSDSTVEKVASYQDPRIRIVRNETNVGLVGNHNKSVEVARGELIQFVHADDRLLPDCLEKLVATFEPENVGLAFAPRRVETTNTEWFAEYGNLHTPLTPLQPINSGAEIVHKYLAAGAEGNWIGEPTSVMFRRELMLEIGGFRAELPQLQDIDAWIRMLTLCDAAFIDEELTVRWHHAGSETDLHVNPGSAALDHMRLVSGLARSRGLRTSDRVRAVALWLRILVGTTFAAIKAPRGERSQRFRNIAAHFRELTPGSRVGSARRVRA
jgi:glycosyltransferase involved in cell wall biosynthesis